MWLHKHAAKLEERVSRVVKIVDPLSAKEALSSTDRLLIERAVMQLQIEWDLFVRKVILDSSLGTYSDLSGKVCSHLPKPPRNRSEASKILISTYPRRDREPDWYDTGHAIDAALRLNLSNFQKIASTLGVSPWVINDLRWLRNFIAHPSEYSALKVRALNLVQPTSAIDVAACVVGYDSNGQNRYRTWSNFIVFAGWQLVK